MSNRPLIAALLLAGLSSAAQAQITKQQFDADTKRIATRYAEDKKLCGDERDSGARMQCLRDSKTEYDKAMTQARAQYKGPGKPGACHECGKVTSVVLGEKAGESSAVGLIAGGVAGALLGNQVGSGHGRQLATVAGAVGGAVMGNQVEGNMNASHHYEIKVRLDDGTLRTFHQQNAPAWRTGDRVRVVKGGLRAA